MFAEFNDQCREILGLTESDRKRFGIIGSESLLLALAKVPSSSCSFILNEYGANQYTIEKEIDKLVVLRKHTDRSDYTAKFTEILKNAKTLATVEESKYVFDEHIFYSLLTTPDSAAINILERLGLDPGDLLEDLNSIYNFAQSDAGSNYLINITREAKMDHLSPFIGREDVINKIIRILSKKQKNNPMLIGNAGVGKSALVEGVAMKLLKTNPSINIYRLDLGMVIAGTKYRGDLEERLLEVIEKIKNPNSIVFIDEIHNIVGSGSSEGTLDIANILKPILARSEIKCIGATTLDEYYRYIEKDKALSRRFQNVFVDEASPEEAYEIIKGIKYKYEEFHKVKYEDVILRYIISSSAFLSNRKLPDKAIDILDESGLVCRQNGRTYVMKEDVDKIVFECLGIHFAQAMANLKKLKNFPSLSKYYRQYFMNLDLRRTIVNVQTAEENIEQLIEDLKIVFCIKDEVVLTLDLSQFQEAHFTSSLIGSPAGYVGYDDGGILTEHIMKFPIAVVIVKNYQKGNRVIINQLENILREGKIIDSKGRTVSFRNTVFVFADSEGGSSIGFLSQETKESGKLNAFIDEILLKSKQNNYYSRKLKNILLKMKDFNYNIVIDIKDIDQPTYTKVIRELSNFDNFKPHRTYVLKYVDNKIQCETVKRS